MFENWTDLPTNHQDAVWDGLKKYVMVQNGDGTVSFLDSTVYQHREDALFGAEELNKANGAINTLVTQLPQTYLPLSGGTVTGSLEVNGTLTSGGKGFAPVLWGLEPIEIISANSDLNSYITPGYYGCRGSSDSGLVSNYPLAGKTFALKVEQCVNFYNPSYTWQYRRQVITTIDGYTLRRFFYNKDSLNEWIFEEWEFENPPMVEGVEYRTTERYNGNPVYCKLIDCGALPNTALATVSLGVSNIFYWSGYVSYWLLALPIGDDRVRVAISSGTAFITTDRSFSAGGRLYLSIKYHK